MLNQPDRFSFGHTLNRKRPYRPQPDSLTSSRLPNCSLVKDPSSPPAKPCGPGIIPVAVGLCQPWPRRCRQMEFCLSRLGLATGSLRPTLKQPIQVESNGCRPAPMCPGSRIVLNGGTSYKTIRSCTPFRGTPPIFPSPKIRVCLYRGGPPGVNW